VVSKIDLRKLPPLNALKGFEATTRRHSVREAADELCVTHPAVSHQIQLLENDLGVQLFSREGRSIVPTPEGAKATSTLLTMQNKTTERGDPIHWEGGYEDTLVKTAKGWRFKQRIHVWSEVKWTDKPQDMPKRNLADE